MNSREKALYTLSCIEILSYVQKGKLIELFENDFDELWNKFEKRHTIVSKLFGDDKYSFLNGRFNEAAYETSVSALYKAGFNFCTLYSEDYPKRLKNTPAPPYTLFYKGDMDIFNLPTVSIAGSRKHSGYGRKAAEYFASEFAQNGITVAGGLSIGIESVAHHTVLSNKGKTAAVLPCGFYNVYPAENLSLFRKIAEDGVVVSEHNPHARLLNTNFEQRNRLLAALCNAVVFVEAGATSGVFSIFEYAMELGRDVFVLPGDIFSPFSEGTNALIKSYPSLIATSPVDVIAAFKTVYKPKKVEHNIILSSEEKLVVNLLLQNALTLNELVDKTGYSINDLGYIVSCLELTGIIRKEVNSFILNSEVVNEISNS